MHAGEAFGAGAAEEAQEEEFELVVGVVGEGEEVDFAFAGGLGEELVAGLAGGHFEGDFLLFGEGADVGLGEVAGEVEFCGGLGDEALVGVAGAGAESVVEVGDFEAPLVGRGELGEGVEEDHGVEAAGDAEEEAGAVGDKVVLADECVELVEEFVHGALSVVSSQLTTDN